MKRLIDDHRDNRQPVAFLNFSKKVKPSPHQPVGPNTLGEYYWPVTVSGNGKRVGYSLIEPMEEVDE